VTRPTRLAVLAGMAGMLLSQPFAGAGEARVDFFQLQRSLQVLDECKKDLIAWLGPRTGSSEFEVGNNLLEAISSADSLIMAIYNLYNIVEMCGCQSLQVSRYLEAASQSYIKLIENRLEALNLSLGRINSRVAEDAGVRARTEIRKSLEILRSINHKPQ
jgi:copper oxidase (laccase) domain-containing protein